MKLYVLEQKVGKKWQTYLTLKNKRDAEGIVKRIKYFRFRAVVYERTGEIL